MTFGIYLDSNRCGGCHACAIACMDQNDLEVEEQIAWRWVFAVEKGNYPEVSVTLNSLACRHCQDPLCVMVCPSGAVARLDGVVLVNTELCIGCHSCFLACPFGIPRFGLDGRMQKCNLCIERVQHGVEPACVRTCPAQALKFCQINE